MQTQISTHRVLIVEDDSSSRNALVMLMKHHGFEPTSAASIGEALTLLDSDPMHIVLDLMLPDGSGTIVMREVQKRGLAARIAVLTGANDPQLLQTVQSLHPSLIMRKPVDVTRLIGWLNNTIV